MNNTIAAAEEMRLAVEEYLELKQQWEALEKEHLSLREEILK